MKRGCLKRRLLFQQPVDSEQANRLAVFEQFFSACFKQLFIFSIYSRSRYTRFFSLLPPAF